MTDVGNQNCRRRRLRCTALLARMRRTRGLRAPKRSGLARRPSGLGHDGSLRPPRRPGQRRFRTEADPRHLSDLRPDETREGRGAAAVLGGRRAGLSADERRGDLLRRRADGLGHDGQQACDRHGDLPVDHETDAQCDRLLGERALRHRPGSQTGLRRLQDQHIRRSSDDATAHGRARKSANRISNHRRTVLPRPLPLRSGRSNTASPSPCRPSGASVEPVALRLSPWNGNFAGLSLQVSTTWETLRAEEVRLALPVSAELFSLPPPGVVVNPNARP